MTPPLLDLHGPTELEWLARTPHQRKRSLPTIEEIEAEFTTPETGAEE